MHKITTQKNTKFTFHSTNLNLHRFTIEWMHSNIWHGYTRIHWNVEHWFTYDCCHKCQYKKYKQEIKRTTIPKWNSNIHIHFTQTPRNVVVSHTKKVIAQHKTRLKRCCFVNAIWKINIDLGISFCSKNNDNKWFPISFWPDAIPNWIWNVRYCTTARKSNGLCGKSVKPQL